MRQAVSGKRLIDLLVSLSDPLDATPFFFYIALFQASFDISSKTH